VPSGVNRELEEAADELLAADRADGPKAIGAIYGILLPDQLALRAEREVLVDPSTFSTLESGGLYRRAYNPLFGKRPVRLNDRHVYGNPDFDNRVGSRIRSGWSEDLLWPQRDPAGVVHPRDGYYWHLDRFQRSRIRAIMRKIPPDRQDARRVLKVLLGLKYGVPDWVIARCLT